MLSLQLTGYWHGACWLSDSVLVVHHKAQHSTLALHADCSQTPDYA